MRRSFPVKYRLLAAMALLLVPLTVGFAFFNSASVWQINNQLAQANRSALSTYCNSVLKDIRRTETFLNLLWNGSDPFARLGRGDFSQSIEDQEELMQELESGLSGNGALSAMIITARGEDIWLPYFPGGSSDNAPLFRKELPTLLEYEDLSGWELVFLGGEPYWLRSVKLGMADCVALINIRDVARSAQTLYALSSPVVFWNNGFVLTEALWMQRGNFAFAALDERDFAIHKSSYNREYMIVNKPFLGMTVFYGVLYRNNIGALGWLRTGPFIFFGVTAIAVIGAWLYLRHGFFRPLGELVETMKRIQANDLTARTKHYSSREFAQVNETFNNMIDKITSLRIESYERQLKVQSLQVIAGQARMDALRMQIRPHFIINCLKNIYGLAQTGNMQDIQTLILLLSNHLRYTFSIQNNVVSLEQELKMCRNYLGLQAVGQVRQPVCRIQAAPAVLEVQVPPISLLTLVENSVKHGSGEQALSIDIEADRLPMEGGFLTRIVLRDNGPGFPPDQLQQLNQRGNPSPDDERVGLRNVCDRFDILYGERFAICFSNRNGAQVEILISEENGDL